MFHNSDFMVKKQCIIWVCCTGEKKKQQDLVICGFSARKKKKCLKRRVEII